MKYITALVIIVVALLLMGAAIPMDRWLYWLQPGEQLIFVDDNGLTRQVTFVDAVPSGYGMGCRIHESVYWMEDDEYGEPLRGGRPTWKANYFEEQNFAADLYFIYQGGYPWEKDTTPFMGCYATDDPYLLVFSIEPFTKQVIDIRVRGGE